MHARRREFGLPLYPADQLLDGVLSLGCGNPVATADLRSGETVIDLGSGAGLDLLLSARRVGPSGRVIGLDVTPEMVELARRNAEAAGVTNVEVLLGHIEQIPMPADSVDVAISNCVLNLAADKQRVLHEVARVLRPGGRLGISDLLAEHRIDPDQVAELACTIGVGVRPITEADYRRILVDVGFTDIRLRPSHTPPHPGSLPPSFRRPNLLPRSARRATSTTAARSPGSDAASGCLSAAFPGVAERRACRDLAAPESVEDGRAR